MPTKIEWAEETWNPILGCTAVSDGCDHCYSAREASGRLKNLALYAGLAEGGKFTGEVRLVPERLEQPMRWQRPRRIFVNSMSDLFHDDVPDGFIAQIWNVMAHCPQHTFQILTKRHARMRSWVTRWADHAEEGGPKLVRGPEATRAAHPSGRGQLFAAMLDQIGTPPPGAAYPTFDWMEGQRWWPSVLPNVWLGVSVEDQHWADIRIPALLDTPAAVRWISAEPLLGSVDLFTHLFPDKCPGGCGCRWPEEADWKECACDGPCVGDTDSPDEWNPRTGIDWVVVGGESGPGARPMHPDWARYLRDQCQEAQVPFLFKQHGEWIPAPSNYGPDVPERAQAHTHLVFSGLSDVDGRIMLRAGKKKAGRELDGRLWDQYPAGA